MIRGKDKYDEYKLRSELHASDFIKHPEHYSDDHCLASVKRFMNPENIESLTCLLNHFRNYYSVNADTILSDSKNVEEVKRNNDYFQRTFLKVFLEILPENRQVDSLGFQQLFRLLLRMSESDIVDCFSVREEKENNGEEKDVEKLEKKENLIKFKNLLSIVKHYLGELTKELTKNINCKDLVEIIINFF
jgi:hypothetical protein